RHACPVHVDGLRRAHRAFPTRRSSDLVLYRDPHLAVVDKPAGLMAHASALARGERDFLADRLREQFGGPVYMVHRLDRATSGCLDRKSTRLNSSHVKTSYAVFCLKKKN